MEAFYFGPADRSLFGAYHDAGAARDRAVLVVPPHNHEYIRSHRAMRTLAQQLAGLGCDVLRVELTGQGDSWGAADDGDVAQWTADLKLALAELRERTMARRIAAVGLRLGATLLAAAASAGGLELDELVLWEPVLRGSDYLAELDRLQVAMLADPNRYSPPRRAPSPSAPREQLGFAISPAQRESIGALDLVGQIAWTTPRVTIVAEQDTLTHAPSAARIERLLTMARTAGRTGKLVKLGPESIAGWDELAKIEETLQGAEAIRAITGELCGGGA